MEALLPLIAVWLSANFGLPVTTEMPSVAYLSDDDLAKVVSGAAGGRRKSVREVVAAYSDDQRTIFISSSLSHDEVAESAILVHEMVHHMQNVGGLSYECLGARESLAFEAQAAWLIQFDRDLATEFELDSITLKVLTTCMTP